MPSMILNEILRFNNKIKTTLQDAQTGEIISTIVTPNTVTNTGKQLVLDRLGNTEIGIVHGAVGTGGASTSAGTILLVSELARNPVVFTRVGQTGTLSVFFNVAKANSSIVEIAFFGGTSSYTSTNTGTMFNRVVLASAITKTSNYTLTVDLDVEV